jgi:uncharacterized protein
MPADDACMAHASSPRPLALVTGASAGIGEAMCRQLAQRGYDLVLVARRVERLQSLADELRADGAQAFVMPCDLAAPGAVPQLLTRIAAECPPVDLLVNNAGYGLDASFTALPWSAHEAFLRVLLSTTVELAHGLLPGMLARRSGRIANIASLAAFAPDPPGTLYSATKKFMVSFTRALQAELRGSGVTATAVCPGFTYSEFHDVMGNRQQMKKLPKCMWLDAATVARLGLDAVMSGRTVVIPGTVNKILAALCWLLPSGLITRLSPRAALTWDGSGNAK